MDYGKILSRAWEITWRWKILWILGFLAALGRGGGGGNASYTTDSGDWGKTYTSPQIPPEWIGIIVAVLCLALIIGIAVWVVSVISRGGLIAGVQQVEDEGSTSLGQAWRVGASRFWTLFGIGILAALPLILMLIAGVVMLVTMIAGGVALADVAEGQVAGVVIPALFCGGALCCGAIILAVILQQIRIYAERAAILEGLGWIDAFVRGWEVLRANIGPTIVLWLIFFAIGLILAILIFLVLLALFVPFIAVVATVEPGAWMIAPACCGGLVTLIVVALLSAIVETFSSATWTLAYRDMAGLAAQAAAEPVLE